MTLNGQYALLQKRCVLRSPPEKDLNEDRPIVSVAKCRPMTLVSGNIRYMQIFADAPRGWGVKRQWGCQRRWFSSLLLATCSEVLDRIYSPTSTFQWSPTPNAWPWMTLN